jgi:hypothetical protein
VAPTPTTIPTSFVPKQPVRTGTRFAKTGGNTFLVLSLILFGVAVFGAGAVFGFERYLLSVSDSKSAELDAAQARVDASKVEEFIRTRDRFIVGKGILDTHVAASNFFKLLETLTLQNVRFNSLSFRLGEDRASEIGMEGTALTFNALAAQSSAVAAEKRIKRAIFSDIKVNENKTVSFSLAAELDPKLLTLLAEDAPNVPVSSALGTSTPFILDTSGGTSTPLETGATPPTQTP